MDKDHANIKGRIYFAGPLFCKGEKDFNLSLARLLEENGYILFLPQRDGYEAAVMVGKTEQEKIDMIFNKDVSEILKADIFFMVLDGRVPDDGACVELGIAYANNKRCYGVKSDVRSIEIDMDLNPLIAGCFTKIFKNFNGNALIQEVNDYLKSNTL